MWKDDCLASGFHLLMAIFLLDLSFGGSLRQLAASRLTGSLTVGVPPDLSTQTPEDIFLKPCFA